MTRTLAFIALSLILGLGCKSKSNIQRLEPTKPISMQSLNVCSQSLEMDLRDTLDFGSMRQGEVITKSLRINNCDTEPLVLLRHVTSCGCVDVLYDRKPIAPNDSTVIEFEFNSKSLSGWQMKLMEFYFADKATPMKIYIDAEVE